MAEPRTDLTIPQTLVQLLRVRASQWPANGFTFLPETESSEARLSFAELDRQARAVAAALQERGLTGQRVLLCYPPGVEFLAGLFGCLYAGAVAVPLYPPRAHRADERLESVVADCDPALVLTCREISPDYDRRTARSPRLHCVPWLDTSTVPANLGENWRDPLLCRDSLALLQYTSGSTGTPKGVMLHHGALLHNLACMCDILGLSPQMQAVSWLPAFHDMGLIGNLLETLFCGGSLTILSPVAFVRDPFLWLRNITARRAYISGGPCFAFQHCLSRATPERCAGLDLRSWEVAYVGAEPVSPAILDRFAQTFAPFGFRREAFFPCYGLAEATLMVTGGDRAAAPVIRHFRTDSLEEHRVETDPRGQRLVGCGRPLPELDICIVDPATCEAQPQGRVGEIWVAGPSVASGYWNRAAELDGIFQARPSNSANSRYLRTGDLGFFWDGELFINGRLKELIIIRGRNYYPQDIEAAVQATCSHLRDLPGAAFTIDRDSGPLLVIVHEVARGYRAGRGDELFALVRQAVAEQFELEVHALVLVRVGSIPRGSSGKLRRNECCRLFQTDKLSIVEQMTGIAAPETADVGPQPIQPETLSRSELEAAVRRWLIDRLASQVQRPAEQIDVTRPFAAYGLDSVVIVAIAAEMQQWLGRPMSPTLLYSAPTIAALAQRIACDVHPEALASQAPTVEPCNDAIAVIGIGCRFPGASGPEAFWELLSQGRCAVAELPRGRWRHIPDAVATTRAGYLDDVQQFDAPFFGIAPREAVFMDPQHRLLLEVAWEALEHAGIAPDRLAGSPVGVFVGISANDYARLLLDHAGHADAYLGSGNATSMAAHRLSYHLDLRGPSMAIDTACSSSLVAVHLACQSLRSGECCVALAGGVNLILAPELSEALSRAGMLSPSGLCKTFDASGDGYVRGEGCGVVVLKPLTAARRDGDAVLAVIEGSALNQDGRSNGITAPNGAAQAELIRHALRLARRSPADVTCIEAHGTGTPLGDPIEVEALAAALGPAGHPCALASVKTNLGHLEAAAGIAGLIKTVLQVQHCRIAPHLHLQEINPRIPLLGSRLRIPTRLETWDIEDRQRLAGVSSFGFGGTNAHILIAPPPWHEPGVAASIKIDRSHHLLPLSAQSEPALRAQATRFADWLDQHAEVPFADVCATASKGRSHFAHRLAIHGADARTAATSLRSWAARQQPGTLHAGKGSEDLTGRVAFLFTGQGAMYPGIASRLLETCPVFRDTFNRCEMIVGDVAGFSIREVIATPSRLDDTSVAQPVLFALEYALAQMWRHWGIEPAAVLGHSLGEYVAACVAGVLSLEDALAIVASRGRLMQACPEGAMLACIAPLPRVQHLLDSWGDQLAIAAINAPENVVVSGTPAAIEAFREQLAGNGIEGRTLRVSRAFHSALIEPSIPDLVAKARTMRHSLPVIGLISNRTGEFTATAPAPEYWGEHARNPVQFAAGLQTLQRAGITHFLEIGPDPVLCRLGASCLPASSAAWLHSLRRDREEWPELLASLGSLYVDGARVAWERLDDTASRRVALPTYPFQRRRFWIDDIPSTTVVRERHDRATPPVDPPLEWQPKSCWSQHLQRTSPGFTSGNGRIAQLVAGVASEVMSRHSVERFPLVQQEFDRLAGAYLVRSFQQLGWHPAIGEQVTTEGLAARLGVVDRYRRLLERLLAMAAEDGWLRQCDAAWEVLRVTVADDVEAWHTALRDRFPDFASDLRLAHHCAAATANVMRGLREPLEVLFGSEAATLTAGLYENSPVARFYNELVGCVVRELARALPQGRPLRILELGAGTGGTTSHVLSRLPAGAVEYVFTDVAPVFVAQARQKFAAHPFMQYLPFDLEQDPAHQGFADGQFDMVLAANVFHATSDIRRCLRSVRRLLVPGGALVMLEGTGPCRLLDVIFGLTEGWWRFNDTGLRSDYPLLPPPAWVRLLREEGLTDAVVLPGGDPAGAGDQVVILAGTSPAKGSNGTTAGKNGTTGGHGSNGFEPRTWLLLGDASELADALATRLRYDGDTVLTAHDLAAAAALLDGSRVSTPWRVVDFRGGPSTLTNSRLRERWLVTCGGAGHFGETQAGLESETRAVDLDPAVSLHQRAVTLYEALRHPDGERVVIYRGDQRFVPRLRPSEPESTGNQATSPAASSHRAELLAAHPNERRLLLERYLRTELAVVLGLDEASIDILRPLQSLGLDSLMGIQLRNRVEANLGIPLSVVDFLKGLTLQQIAGNAQAAMAELSSAAAAAAPVPELPAELSTSDVDHLSERELNSLLQSVLGGPGPSRSEA